MVIALKTLLAIILFPVLLFGATDVVVYDGTASYTWAGAGADRVFTVASGSVSDITNGLVAWWKFEGNANDSMGVYNGTVYGPTLTTGHGTGQAYYFSTNGYIGTATIPLTNMTVSMWINLVTNTPECIVMESRFAVYKWGLNHYAGKPSFFYRQSDAAGKQTVSSAETEVSTNTWHMFTGVADGGYIYCYVDGVQYGTVVAYDGTGAADAVIFIGKDFANATRFVTGVIDDVRLYSRGLASNEVNQVYNATK